jgi:hypothetical protein
MAGGLVPLNLNLHLLSTTERVRSLLHKCLKTALFMYRARVKAHQFGIDFVPNKEFRVYATDSVAEKKGLSCSRYQFCVS